MPVDPPYIYGILTPYEPIFSIVYIAAVTTPHLVPGPAFVTASLSPSLNSLIVVPFDFKRDFNDLVNSFALPGVTFGFIVQPPLSGVEGSSVA